MMHGRLRWLGVGVTAVVLTAGLGMGETAKRDEVWGIIRQLENGPPAVSPLPTDVQLKYHHLEKQMFIHFTVNNFTGREWGDGEEDPNVRLLYRSWQEAAKTSPAIEALVQRHRKRPHLELYNLTNDPWEMNDLADHPEHEHALATLLETLESHLKGVGETL